MTGEIAIGLTCGLASAAVSEAVLRLGEPLLRRSLFKALALGAALRTVWVLAVTAWALSVAAVDARGFVPALLVGYLAAQTVEGFRYTRFFGRC